MADIETTSSSAAPATVQSQKDKTSHDEDEIIDTPDYWKSLQEDAETIAKIQEEKYAPIGVTSSSDELKVDPFENFRN